MAKARRRSTDDALIGDLVARHMTEAQLAKRGRNEGLAIGRKWGADLQRAQANIRRSTLRAMAIRLFQESPKLPIKLAVRLLAVEVAKDPRFLGRGKKKPISEDTIAQLIKGVKTGVLSGADPLSLL